MFYKKKKEKSLIGLIKHFRERHSLINTTCLHVPKFRSHFIMAKRHATPLSHGMECIMFL